MRWICSTPKKTKNDAVKSVFYYCLGYDISSFMTRNGRYQIPEIVLEVIKGLRYVPATECYGERCPLIEGNTLGQTISKYSEMKRDSVPCSVFSIVQLNKEYQEFKENMDIKILLKSVGKDLERFNELVLEQK